MIARCPRNPEHKRFVTVATVTEDWVVDEHGHFVDVAPSNEPQTLHGPDPGNTWTCEICGEKAKVNNE